MSYPSRESTQTNGSPYWLWPVIVSGSLCAGLLTGYVLIYRGEISALVCAAREKIGNRPLEAIRVGFPTSGFDGQYYYAIAQDPWGRHDDFLDVPAQRHSRILFPAVAWAMTGGDAHLLLWALPVINWAAIVGITWMGIRLATHYGRSPWWGSVVPVAINAFAPALRDLTDPLSMFAVCGLLTAWFLRRGVWSFVLWGLLAALSREQNLLIIALVLFESIASRRFKIVAVLLISIGVWFGWLIVLRQMYGTWPDNSGNIAVPFAGIWHRLNHMTGSLHSYSSPVHILGMATLVSQILLSVGLLGVRAEGITRLVALTGAGLAIMGGVPIYMNVESYNRVFWWMPLGVWIWCMQTGRFWPLLVLSLNGVWPVYGLAQAWLYVQRGVITFI